jgi:hypothetical protein
MYSIEKARAAGESDDYIANYLIEKNKIDPTSLQGIPQEKLLDHLVGEDSRINYPMNGAQAINTRLEQKNQELYPEKYTAIPVPFQDTPIMMPKTEAQNAEYAKQKALYDKSPNMPGIGGALWEAGAQPIKGALNLPKRLVGSNLEAAGTAIGGDTAVGGFLQEAGKAWSGFSDKAQEFAPPSQQSLESPIRNTLIGGVQSASEILLSGLIPGGAIAYGAGIGSEAGLGLYKDMVAKGKSHEEALSYGVINGGVQGVLETYLNKMTLGLAKPLTGLIGKAIVNEGEQALKSTAKELIGVYGFKQFFKNIGKMAMWEGTEEVAQQGTEDILRKIGMDETKTPEAYAQDYALQFLGGAFAGLLIGHASQGMNMVAMKPYIDALQNPATGQDVRLSAKDAITQLLTPQSLEAAKAWDTLATRAVIAGDPIPVDTQFAAFINVYNNNRTTASVNMLNPETPRKPLGTPPVAAPTPATPPTGNPPIDLLSPEVARSKQVAEGRVLAAEEQIMNTSDEAKIAELQNLQEQVGQQQVALEESEKPMALSKTAFTSKIAERKAKLELKAKDKTITPAEKGMLNDMNRLSTEDLAKAYNIELSTPTVLKPVDMTNQKIVEREQAILAEQQKTETPLPVQEQAPEQKQPTERETLITGLEKMSAEIEAKEGRAAASSAVLSSKEFQRLKQIEKEEEVKTFSPERQQIIAVASKMPEERVRTEIAKEKANLTVLQDAISKYPKEDPNIAPLQKEMELVQHTIKAYEDRLNSLSWDSHLEAVTTPATEPKVQVKQITERLKVLNVAMENTSDKEKISSIRVQIKREADKLKDLDPDRYAKIEANMNLIDKMGELKSVSVFKSDKTTTTEHPTIGRFLNDISRNSDSVAMKQLSTYLLKKIESQPSKLNMKIVHSSVLEHEPTKRNIEGKGSGAYYHYDSDEIRILRGSIAPREYNTAVLHEVVHALTSKKIRAHMSVESKYYNKIFYTITKAASEEMKITHAYAFSNPREFLAMIFTDSQLIQDLEKLKIDISWIKEASPNIHTAWEAILDVFKKILGMDVAKDSALGHSLKALDSLLKEGAKLQEKQKGTDEMFNPFNEPTEEKETTEDVTALFDIPWDDLTTAQRDILADITDIDTLAKFPLSHLTANQTGIIWNKMDTTDEFPSESKATVKVGPMAEIKTLHNAGKGVYTMRVYDDSFKKLDKDHHFGNPFGVTGVTTSSSVPNAGTIKEVSQRYYDWLSGKADKNIEPDRRVWINKVIDMGLLDGKNLLYFQQTEINHAKMLAKYINERSIKETLAPWEEQKKEVKTFSDIVAGTHRNVKIIESPITASMAALLPDARFGYWAKDGDSPITLPTYEEMNKKTKKMEIKLKGWETPRIASNAISLPIKKSMGSFYTDAEFLGSNKPESTYKKVVMEETTVKGVTRAKVTNIVSPKTSNIRIKLDQQFDTLESYARSGIRVVLSALDLTEISAHSPALASYLKERVAKLGAIKTNEQSKRDVEVVKKTTVPAASQILDKRTKYKGNISRENLKKMQETTIKLIADIKEGFTPERVAELKTFHKMKEKDQVKYLRELNKETRNQITERIDLTNLYADTILRFGIKEGKIYKSSLPYKISARIVAAYNDYHADLDSIPSMLRSIAVSNNEYGKHYIPTATGVSTFIEKTTPLIDQIFSSKHWDTTTAKTASLMAIESYFEGNPMSYEDIVAKITKYGTEFSTMSRNLWNDPEFQNVFSFQGYDVPVPPWTMDSENLLLSFDKFVTHMVDKYGLDPADVVNSNKMLELFFGGFIHNRVKEEWKDSKGKKHTVYHDQSIIKEDIVTEEVAHINELEWVRYTLNRTTPIMTWKGGEIKENFKELENLPINFALGLRAMIISRINQANKIDDSLFEFKETRDLKSKARVLDKDDQLVPKYDKRGAIDEKNILWVEPETEKDKINTSKYAAYIMKQLEKTGDWLSFEDSLGAVSIQDYPLIIDYITKNNPDLLHSILGSDKLIYPRVSFGKGEKGKIETPYDFKLWQNSETLRSNFNYLVANLPEFVRDGYTIDIAYYANKGYLNGRETVAVKDLGTVLFIKQRGITVHTMPMPSDGKYDIKMMVQQLTSFMKNMHYMTSEEAIDIHLPSIPNRRDDRPSTLPKVFFKKDLSKSEDDYTAPYSYINDTELSHLYDALFSGGIKAESLSDEELQDHITRMRSVLKEDVISQRELWSRIDKLKEALEQDNLTTQEKDRINSLIKENESKVELYSGDLKETYNSLFNEIMKIRSAKFEYNYESFAYMEKIDNVMNYLNVIEREKARFLTDETTQNVSDFVKANKAVAVSTQVGHSKKNKVLTTDQSLFQAAINNLQLLQNLKKPTALEVFNTIVEKGKWVVETKIDGIQQTLSMTNTLAEAAYGEGDKTILVGAKGLFHDRPDIVYALNELSRIEAEALTVYGIDAQLSQPGIDRYIDRTMGKYIKRSLGSDVVRWKSPENVFRINSLYGRIYRDPLSKHSINNEREVLAMAILATMRENGNEKATLAEAMDLASLYQETIREISKSTQGPANKYIIFNLALRKFNEAKANPHGVESAVVDNLNTIRKELSDPTYNQEAVKQLADYYKRTLSKELGILRMNEIVLKSLTQDNLYTKDIWNAVKTVDSQKFLTDMDRYATADKAVLPKEVADKLDLDTLFLATSNAILEHMPKYNTLYLDSKEKEYTYRAAAEFVSKADSLGAIKKEITNALLNVDAIIARKTGTKKDLQKAAVGMVYAEALMSGQIFRFGMAKETVDTLMTFTDPIYEELSKVDPALYRGEPSKLRADIDMKTLSLPYTALLDLYDFIQQGSLFKGVLLRPIDKIDFKARNMSKVYDMAMDMSKYDANNLTPYHYLVAAVEAAYQKNKDQFRANMRGLIPVIDYIGQDLRDKSFMRKRKPRKDITGNDPAVTKKHKIDTGKLKDSLPYLTKQQPIFNPTLIQNEDGSWTFETEEEPGELHRIISPETLYYDEFMGMDTEYPNVVGTSQHIKDRVLSIWTSIREAARVRSKSEGVTSFDALLDTYIGTTEYTSAQLAHTVTNMQDKLARIAKDWPAFKKIFDFAGLQGKYLFGNEAKKLDHILYIYYDLFREASLNNKLTKSTDLYKKHIADFNAGRITGGEHGNAYLDKNRIWLLTQAITLAEKLSTPQYANEAKVINDLFNEVQHEYKRLWDLANEAGIITKFITHYQSRRTGEVAKGMNGNYAFKQDTTHSLQREFKDIVEVWRNNRDISITGMTSNLSDYGKDILSTISSTNLIQKGLGITTRYIDEQENPVIYKLVEGINGAIRKLPVFTYKLNQKDEDNRNYVDLEHPNATVFVLRHVLTADQTALTEEQLNEMNMVQVIDKETNIKKVYDIVKVKAHPDIATRLNNLMSKSDLMKFSTVQKTVHYNSAIKRTILQGDFFHHFAFMRQFFFGTPYNEELAKSLGVAGTGLLNPSSIYKRGLALYSQALKDPKDPTILASLAPTEVQIVNILRNLIHSGISFNTAPDWDEMMESKEGRKKLVNLLVKKGVVANFAEGYTYMMENMESFLFKEFGTGLKIISALAVYMDIQNKIKKNKWEFKISPSLLSEINALPETERAAKLQEIQDSEVYKAVAEYTNINFGGLNKNRYKSSDSRMAQFWFSPTVTLFKRILLLAPDWTESNIAGIVKYIKAIKTGNKIERELYQRVLYTTAVRATMLLILGNMLMAAISAMGDDDEDQWDRIVKNWDNEEKLANKLISLMELDITAAYTALGGDPKYTKKLNVLGHIIDPVKAATMPFTFTKNKLGVIPRFGYEGVTGTNFKGETYTTLSEYIGRDFEKGVYAQKAGLFNAGDPKFGMLETRLTKFGKSEPVHWETIPTFAISQGKGWTPIYVQESLNVMFGYNTALEAFMRIGGAQVKTNYLAPLPDIKVEYTPKEKKDITRHFNNRWEKLKTVVRKKTRDNGELSFEDTNMLIKQLDMINQEAAPYGYKKHTLKSLMKIETDIIKYPTPDMAE